MAVVLVLHGTLIAAVWFARVEPPHHDEEALTVAFLSDPAPVRAVALQNPVFVIKQK